MENKDQTKDQTKDQAKEKFDVVLYPDPVLREIATPVETVDETVRTIMEKMLNTMYGDGIGLAANQVGLTQRIIVMDCAQGEDGAPGQPYKMANPEITWIAEDEHTMDEGCLSFPGVQAPVTRPQHLKVTYLDENNTEQELEAEGLLAVCIQHEIDHLDGKMFFDYSSKLKRDMLMKKYKKLRKAHKKS